MAVSPKKLQESLGVEASQAADDFEARLDAHLTEHWDGQDFYTAEIKGNLNKRTRDEIERRYKQAGWAKITWPNKSQDSVMRIKLHIKK